MDDLIWQEITVSGQLKTFPLDAVAVHAIAAIDSKYIPGMVKRLKHLQYLHIDYALQVTNENLEVLAEKCKLISLEVNYTDYGITDRGIKAISTIMTLRYLVLRDLRLTDKGFKYLVKLTNLEKLVIDYTPLTDAAFEIIHKLPKLKHLELIGLNYITNKAISHLHELKNLEYLALGSYRIKKNCYKYLKNIESLKTLNITDHSGIKYQDCYTLARKLDCQVLFNGTELLHKVTGDDFDSIWKTVLESSTEQPLTCLSELPPADYWIDDFNAYLIEQMKKCKKAELGHAAEMAYSFLTSSDFQMYSDDILYKQMLALEQLLNLTLSRKIKVKILLRINESYNRLNICDFKLNQDNLIWYSDLLLHKIDRTGYMQTLAGYDREIGYYSILNYHICRVGDNKIDVDLNKKERDAVEKIIGHINEVMFCSCCGAKYSRMEVGAERCGKCWEKSFDDWNEHFEDLDRKDDE